MDNPEKRVPYGTQDKEKQNTIWVWHHYAQANTYNINKTRVFLQTTGCKDEPNIVFLPNGYHNMELST
jgi:hypothetical protein